MKEMGPYQGLSAPVRASHARDSALVSKLLPRAPPFLMLFLYSSHNSTLW